MTRTHVGERKLEDLDAIEATAGGDEANDETAISMSDACYNALAKLTRAELLAVQMYIREIVSTQRERSKKEAE